MERGPDATLIDLEHLGRARVIGCWRLGDVLVDPGPESCLETLLGALEHEPRALLLTHIHLDHAGASGALVERFGELEVWVHERGAPHLADPAKLLRSAARLYGDQMDRLWGRVTPVPEANIRALHGGETVHVGEREIEVVYAPGHASHHVVYLDRRDRTAYVGDVAGVRIPPADFVLAPTPPPDIDIEAWRRSIAIVGAMEPRSLALTHFGALDEPAPHLDRITAELGRVAERVRGLLEAGDDGGSFESELLDRLGESADVETVAAYVQAAPPEQLWLGLRRYWREWGVAEMTESGKN